MIMWQLVRMYMALLRWCAEGLSDNIVAGLSQQAMLKLTSCLSSVQISCDKQTLTDAQSELLCGGSL
jgi:hypothetical protein